jgi:hypothetical protein
MTEDEEMQSDGSPESGWYGEARDLFAKIAG